ncbi:50S ribosomal protein L3 [Luteolibacter pohnpeiensis]|uniref:Large ribosomal subunit protein uL3 n=1 Tax=Luteolibacter pohnpeiensis TaxID=454153 RepID=A0A934S596_9BACT|nr:50S ribosomal protein L3 [Luteolibacter pohnpeiensis]MBK1882821.1 50S ribosomal protein L3 [Luteolibacter pohnpeiensis]
MSLGLLGKKIGMTRLFDEQAGSMIPVTVIDVSGNTLLQSKTTETDGYTAVQVGFDDQKEQRVSKPDLGRFKKAGCAPKRIVKEFRFESGATLPTEHTGLETFTEGQFVDVIGTTKGRGFQGAVKRHGFGGLKQTHGSMMHRRTGAIGCRSTPGRVWKNQKMPGHMGDVPRTIQNLKVVAVRPEDGVILISGAVPGAKGGYLTIRAAKKKSA